MDWKLKLSAKAFEEWPLGVDLSSLEKFIETQIISKLIEEIPNKEEHIFTSAYTDLSKIKQQLKAKWLSGEKEGE